MSCILHDAPPVDDTGAGDATGGVATTGVGDATLWRWEMPDWRRRGALDWSPPLLLADEKLANGAAAALPLLAHFAHDFSFFLGSAL